MAFPKQKSEPTLRVLRPRRAAPADAARVTRAEIDLARVRHNLHALQALTEAQVWTVLKADGYGHGATQIGVTLEQAGVDGLCVALLEEGIELRHAGVSCPILVMGGYYGRTRDGAEALVEHNLMPVVYDRAQIEGIATALKFMRASLPAHLKIDTGMGRLGARPEQLDGVIQTLGRHREIELKGLMSHLPCADTDLEQTRRQLQLFEKLCDDKLAFARGAMRHAANSAAMLRLPEAQLDMVRPGIATFGVHPCPPSAGAPNLKPAMRVLSEIVALRDLPAGSAIGYGHTWRAERPSRIATIPMGYADGLSRELSNKGHVLVSGRRAPIVGTVSMDLTMIDVSDIPHASVRDEVVILGHQRGRSGDDEITAEEIAAHCGAIPWEVLTSISRRVPRFYRNP